MVAFNLFETWDSKNICFLNKYACCMELQRSYKLISNNRSPLEVLYLSDPTIVHVVMEKWKTAQKQIKACSCCQNLGCLCFLRQGSDSPSVMLYVKGSQLAWLQEPPGNISMQWRAVWCAPSVMQGLTMGHFIVQWILWDLSPWLEESVSNSALVFAPVLANSHLVDYPGALRLRHLVWNTPKWQKSCN